VPRDDAPVRFGLVGYGFGGRYFHAPLIAAATGCELIGVVSNSPDRRALIAQEHPTAGVLGSLAELAAAGAEAVAVSTPADTHSAVSEQALRLGLGVVCDKPFALDAAAARATVALATELGLPLSPYQNRRWDSDFLTVHGLVENGSLGTITRLESRFERFDPTTGPPASGGGTLLDFCSHLVDQALVLLGPVIEVYAESSTRDSGLDDDVFVALTHAGGAHSQLWGSWSQHGPGPRWRVTGTDATYVIDTGDTQEHALVQGLSPAALGEKWGVEPQSGWGWSCGPAGCDPVPSARGAWDLFYPQFAQAVRGQAAVPVDPNDAIATASVLDAARRSTVERVVVPVPAAI